VVFYLKAYNTEWARRLGNGLYDGILPRELEKQTTLTPKNATGTGPFLLESHVDGNVTSYVRNPLAGSTGRRNTGVKSLCWCFKLQGLTWSFV
jgi:hypothetical protein